MSRFSLTLKLVVEPDGEFTLYTESLCPDTCFVPGRFERGAPEGHSPMKSAVPITVHIERTESGQGGCVMTPVCHRVPAIKRPNLAVFLVQVFVIYKGEVVQEQVIHFDQAVSASDAKTLQEGTAGAVTVFNLHGGGIEVTVKLRGTEDTVVEYRDTQGNVTFQGRQIYHDQARLGRMLSVVLSSAPDSYVVVLTLAVPDVNRPANAKSVDVNTFAVRTLVRDSLAGPAGVAGQVQAYEMIALEGNAW